MIKALEGSGDYRILRRLKPRAVFETVAPGQELKIGVLIDLETTGLDTTSDEVIELGLVKFAYLADDRVAHVVDTLGTLNEPTKPIPSEITELAIWLPFSSIQEVRYVATSRIGIKDIRDLDEGGTLWDARVPGFCARRRKSRAVFYALSIGRERGVNAGSLSDATARHGPRHSAR